MLPVLLSRLDGWRLRRLRENRAIAMFAPYSFDVYGSILKRVNRQKLPIVSFMNGGSSDDRSRIFLRHDVDTAACACNLDALLQVEADFSLPSATFIRVDCDEYAPESLRGVVAKRRAPGIEFGLHTVCYLDDDPFAAFRCELDRFADAFGFRARTFTVHGLGTFREDVRQVFSEGIVGRMQEFGIVASDCSTRLRRYDMVFQDCDIDPQSKRRIMYDDMARLSWLPPRGGRSYLVLTHPCYWR